LEYPLTTTCIFCRIIAGHIPANIIAENEHVIVIQDIAPKAPIHYLIIPKKHVTNIQSLTTDDTQVPAHMIMMAKELSTKLSGSQAFRLIANNGSDAGQSVFHMHFHFLSGKKMLDF
jgi:histidine triad (HIT) family protein